MKDLEHRSQVALCQWLDMQRPTILYYATPNGGKRSIKTAKRLKDEGVKAGVPDLCFPTLHLYIEMKSPKGILSEAQKQWIFDLQLAGYKVAVCYSAEEAIKVVEAFRL